MVCGPEVWLRPLCPEQSIRVLIKVRGWKQTGGSPPLVLNTLVGRDLYGEGKLILKIHVGAERNPQKIKRLVKFP